MLSWANFGLADEYRLMIIESESETKVVGEAFQSEHFVAICNT